MQQIPMGGNTVLQEARGKIEVSYTHSPQLDISLTAFLLTNDNKVTGDEGIVFYNQPNGVHGIATWQAPRTVGATAIETLHFDLSKLTNGLTKIAVTLTEDAKQGFQHVQQLKAVLTVGQAQFEFVPPLFSTEQGIVVVELYIHNGQFKAKSIWRGFTSGLAGLCALYGVDIAEETAAPLPAPPPEPVIKLEKVSGHVKLDKGQKSVIIEKTPMITATVSWKTGTDYDIYALVYTKTGEQIDVAMFGAGKVKPLSSYKNGAVKHMGDVGRTASKTKTETIQIRFDSSIVAVVPVVYSAQSNGTGSFHQYKVSMSIDNHHGTSVTIDAKHANKNNRIYTCVPGMLENTAGGVVITPLELYSRPGSEYRPRLKQNRKGNIIVEMDKGPKNDYK